jgi:hypothetical protein
MKPEQLIMAHIDLPVRIIDNMVEPMQEYLHISFTQCDSLPERTDCDLQTALSDKIQEYLHEQNQFDQSAPIEQHNESNEIVQDIDEKLEKEPTIFQDEPIDNTSQYITLEELSNKKKAIHHKHSTFKKRHKNMHNLTCKLRFIS